MTTSDNREKEIGTGCIGRMAGYAKMAAGCMAAGLWLLAAADADAQDGKTGYLFLNVPVSNLSLIDPKSGKATRIAIKKNDEGKKIRVAKKSGEEIK